MARQVSSVYDKRSCEAVKRNHKERRRDPNHYKETSDYRSIQEPPREVLIWMT